jgi:hypothetical protein
MPSRSGAGGGAGGGGAAARQQVSRLALDVSGGDKAGVDRGW